MTGKITIKDVAREAGVSISTVSNALNGVDVLHPDTKAHILEVAERLHYIPNLNGRNLKSQATKVIGLFVDYMGGPYMGALTDSMARQCSANGYELNVFVSSQQDSVMGNLLGRRVDGAIIVHNILSEGQEEMLQEAGIPVVYLNRETAGRYQAGVFFDSYGAGRMAAEYLLGQGIRRFGFLDGPEKYDSRERGRGFRDALSKQGIALPDEFVWQGRFERQTAFDAVSSFLEKAGDWEEGRFPQAVFAVNDLSAIGCMEAFGKAGIHVPGKVKVMGCDDMELCRYVQPALTTVRTNFEEQGAVAVQSLLKMLKDDENGSLVRLTCRIVERDSA